ncbi:diversity-generating retroelement protein Avd [Patescibacteria group bacterium]|nr:diversity-generating retroelement protein Avd [Patescibacteria group bacterium]MCG2692764.1 diversity-generating retroelement protein Avd [Candidatus Parcubacteria bacterium]
MPILQKTTTAYKLWRSFLPHIPRLSRYTLGAKIDTLFAEIVELILQAGYSSRDRKIETVNRASIKFDALKFFLQVAWEMKVLDNKKYAQLSMLLAEIGRMLGGWLKDLKKETPPNLIRGE